MKVLELFSGTHSIGKVVSKREYDVISLDRDLSGSCPWSDYESKIHIKEDIMTWDYTIYQRGEFDIITASPVCLWWSTLRHCWIGRKAPSIHPTETITMKHLEDDIEKFGRPMVDKVLEIIEYFQPKFWWIENPQTGKMKDYLSDKSFYDVDYCKYSDWGYKKRTRIWTNIKGFTPQLCNKDCQNIVNGKHKNSSRNNNWDGKGTLERYRIPEKLIEELIDLC